MKYIDDSAAARIAEDISGRLDAKQDKLVIDTEVTAAGSNAVTGAAVAAYVAEKGGGKTLSNADFLELVSG